MVAVTEFFDAIAVGDVDLVRRMLDQEPGLLANLGPDGASPALTALYNGHAQLADELAARTGELSVFEAAAFDDTARLAELIAADRSVIGSWSADGWQALHLAAYFGRAEAARMLLDADAEVAEPSRNELAVQPLHAAAAGGHFRAGVDPDRLGRPGAGPPARRLDPAALGGGQRRPGLGAGAAVCRRGFGGGQRRGPHADRAGLAGHGARGAARRRRWLTACRGLVERARRQPSAILLAVQLLGVLIYPYLGESRTGTSAVSLFGLLVLALAVWSVETTAWTVWVSIVLGVRR